MTIFQECQPEFLHDLVLKMKAYIFTPGDSICRKGKQAQYYISAANLRRYLLGYLTIYQFLPRIYDVFSSRGGGSRDVHNRRRHSGGYLGDGARADHHESGGLLRGDRHPEPRWTQQVGLLLLKKTFFFVFVPCNLPICRSH